MSRKLSMFLIVAIGTVVIPTGLSRAADVVRGVYLESRTCQVYTGPCFANAEVGLAGKHAILAWGIQDGHDAGVDLSGLNVIVVVKSSETIGHQGYDNAESLKSVIIVDDRADAVQRLALIEFARRHSGRAGDAVVRIESQPIQMALDTQDLRGSLEAGRLVKLTTRKANPDDCICGNEAAYYPPLARVKNFAAGVCIDNEFRGRGLNSYWSSPDSRSGYMGTFEY